MSTQKRNYIPRHDAMSTYGKSRRLEEVSRTLPTHCRTQSPLTLLFNRAQIPPQIALQRIQASKARFHTRTTMGPNTGDHGNERVVHYWDQAMSRMMGIRQRATVDSLSISEVEGRCMLGFEGSERFCFQISTQASRSCRCGVNSRKHFMRSKNLVLCNSGKSLSSKLS
jgi:hypothetical protein